MHKKLTTASLAFALCLVLLSGSLPAQSGNTQANPEKMTAYQEASIRIEWLKAIGTIGAILVPLLIGVFTLRSQSKNCLSGQSGRVGDAVSDALGG
jgi:hypothetical protein